jgi:hypothetical protein
MVVVLVDRPGQLDELRPEVAVPLAPADRAFDLPERPVDGPQLGRQRRKIG